MKGAEKDGKFIQIKTEQYTVLALNDTAIRGRD